MKSIKLLTFCLLFPAVFWGQKTLTGLWTGVLTNDSTAIRKDQSIEIALSQYKQKVTGYSRVTFIINDSLYSIVKRVKGTIHGNTCEVIDDEIISHNFPVKPEKKVKVIYTFLFNPADSTWRMDGKWRTTQTKQYYSISGNTELKEEKDLAKSKLFPHLEELSLADDVDFYKEEKEKEKEILAQQKKSVPPAATKKEIPVAEKKNEPIVKKEEAKPDVISVNKSDEKEITKSEPVAVVANAVSDVKTPISDTRQENKRSEPPKSQPVVATSLKETKPETVAIVKSEEKKPTSTENRQPNENALVVSNIETKKNNTEPPKSQPVVTEKQPEKKPEVLKSEALVVAKPEEKKPVVTTAEQKPANQEKTIVKTADEKQFTADETDKSKNAVMPALQEKLIQAPNVAAAVNERKTVSSQVVTFKSDSLELALYDNGEIDGDTVSVLLNGEVIIAKQGLKVSAIKKTIYIEPGSDELLLVLYAENLGKYPPNTGLLMVYDGDDRYQVRFSADLQQNAAVILRRKK